MPSSSSTSIRCMLRVAVGAALAIPLLVRMPATTFAASSVSDEIKAALAARGVPLTFSDPVLGPAAIAAAGYVPSHGWVAFKGEGVAYGRPPRDGAFDLLDPPVLLYRPTPSGAFSDTQLSDQAPEPGYELVGVAYFQNYYGTTRIEDSPPEAPPSLHPLPDGLRPSGAWFRHTAGCHMSSGEFVAFSENLPEPTLDLVTRLARGIAWCQAIGVNSTWVADSGIDVELGASGRCVLDRDVNPGVGLPRPVRPGSFVRMRASNSSLLPRPPDPPSSPAVVADPGPPPPTGTASPDQVFAYSLYLTAKTTYDNAVAALNTWRQTVATAATAQCQTVGSAIAPPNAPTFWHGTAWDTHLFFDSPLALAGVNDTNLVPNGYVGPPFSFSPGDDNGLVSVAFPPLPPVSAGGPYTVAGGGSVVLSADIGTSTVPVTYAWDLTGTGVFTDSHTKTATFSVAFDTPVGIQYTVRVRVCDVHNQCDTASSRVTVSNDSGQLIINPADGSPPASGTPELDSLLLFSSGFAGLGGYAFLRSRARRRRTL